MNEAIPLLSSYDGPAIDAAFAALFEEVQGEAASSLESEAFRVRWLGRKQGRLKLISDAWLKPAPPDARKALGLRFNGLKQQIEAVLAEAAGAPATGKSKEGIDITLPGSVRPPGIEHPLLKTMHEICLLYTSRCV